MESEHWLGNSSSLAYCIKGEAKILYARESSRTNLFGSVTKHFGDWTTELEASEMALLSLYYWVLQTFIYFQKGCVFLVTEGELRVKPNNSSGLASPKSWTHSTKN